MTRRSIEVRILEKLHPIEGCGRTELAIQLGADIEVISAALQRLKKKGLVENGFGTMGYSWFRIACPS